MALAMTCDYMVAPVNHLRKFADAFDKVSDEILELTEFTWSHWAGIAADVRAIDEKHDSRLSGVGVGCTSVDDPWASWDAKQSPAVLNAQNYVSH